MDGVTHKTMADTSPRNIIMLGIAVAFLVAIVPSALNDFFNVSTATWDSSVATLWPIIPLAIVAIFVFAFLPRGAGGRGGA